MSGHTPWMAGQTFKAVPLTRKAKNAHGSAAMKVGVDADRLMWEMVGALEGDKSKFMGVACGDRAWDTIRRFAVSGDPDWKIEATGGAE